MSKFFSRRYASLTPYVPGEQPKDTQYIKLNTNESPFAPPPSASEEVQAEVSRLQLYSDPENTRLTEKAAEVLGVKPTQVLMTNGSDEALNFAFMAFCDEKRPIAFPDITYGFYSVFADLNNIPYTTFPLKEDFSIDCEEYKNWKGNIAIANPNAPTGIGLSLNEIEDVVKSRADRVVIIDEAYVDFGGESAVKLVDRYDNLLVTQTFSKSRSLAGARLGMAIGNESLIVDLKSIKYSTNPYNVNRMTAAAGYAALCDDEWFTQNIRAVRQAREYTREKLVGLGFEVLPSKANFLFARSAQIGGEALYLALKKKGVLVRHFKTERIKDFNRITVGSKAQMDGFLMAVKEILEEYAK